jgi:hypothetical protein
VFELSTVIVGAGSFGGIGDIQVLAFHAFPLMLKKGALTTRPPRRPPRRQLLR